MQMLIYHQLFCMLIQAMPQTTQTWLVVHNSGYQQTLTMSLQFWIHNKFSQLVAIVFRWTPLLWLVLLLQLVMDVTLVRAPMHTQLGKNNKIIVVHHFHTQVLLFTTMAKLVHWCIQLHQHTLFLQGIQR